MIKQVILAHVRCDMKMVMQQYTKDPLLKVTNLSKHLTVNDGFFSRHKQTLKAVDRVSFSVYEGETLGIVGESGSGKTTLAHLIMNLLRPTAGKIVFDGVQLNELSKREVREKHKHKQMNYKDPYS